MKSMAERRCNIKGSFPITYSNGGENPQCFISSWILLQAETLKIKISLYIADQIYLF